MKLLNEQYRPTELEHFICSDSVRSIIGGFIINQNIPNIILSGSPGIGKTTLAKLLAKQLKCTWLYINASDENGINVVREKIKNFASTASMYPLKIIILDEAEFLSEEAQSALRNVIETFSANTRFIFTCNFPEKIIEPLHSRLTPIDLSDIPKRDVIKRLIEILKLEGIKFDKENLLPLVDTFYPDLRKILNYIQTNSKDKELLFNLNQIDLNYKEQILHHLIDKNKSSFTEIRKIILENNSTDFNNLYRFLFNSCEILPEKSREDFIILLAKYQYQNVFAVDKEINFMGCISEILKL